MRYRIFVLIAFTIITITFIAIWIYKRQIIVTWKFIDLKDIKQIRQILEQKVFIKLEVNITEEQKRKLYDTLSNLLFIYKNGDFNNFVQYLLNRKGIINPQISKLMKTLPIFAYRIDTLPPDIKTKVTKVASQMRIWPPQEDMEIFKAMWLLSYSESGTWNAIAPESGYIRVFQSDQPLSKESVESIIQRHSTYYQTQRSSVVFNRWTLFPGENKRPCLYAEVYFPAKHPTGEPPWGYYLWLRWNDAISDWFLDWAGMDSSGERSESSDILY